MIWDFERSVKFVNIELSANCNLKCLYCSRNKFGNNREPGFMTLTTFDKILDMFPKDVLLQLHLSGEPLMHPEFCEFVRFACQKGFTNTRIHTNATLLTMELSEKLVKSGLTTIVFSIDGADPGDYERIRGFSFDIVKKNIVDFLELNCGTIQVWIQTVVSKDKEKKINSGFLDWQNLYYMNDHLGHGSQLIVVHPHNWIYRNLIPESEDQSCTQRPCYYLHNGMAITYDGDFVPCCNCLNKELVIGNIVNDTAKEVWDHQMELMRRLQLIRQPLRPCSNCERYEPIGELSCK